MSLGDVFEKLGQRIATAGYLWKNRAYADVRKNGGARDLYRLLNKPWLRRLNIGTVVDVGANEGQFIRTAQALLPQRPILAFEPNPQHLESLRTLLAGTAGSEALNMACGREQSQMSLNVSEFSPASSLLPITPAIIGKFPEAATARTISVEVARLDHIVKQRAQLPRPLLLKLDVQGFELEVLRGTTQVFPEVAAIVCEVTTVSFYEGQTAFGELCTFLREHGFRVVDLGEPVRGDDEEAMWFDIAFRNESFDKK
ncbi:MAG: FkbM family methyltransferase [Verrucomicrobiota bacterium]|nr:FkbM family methyltransferase [Verrucomicrobiota bacterium]